MPHASANHEYPDRLAAAAREPGFERRIDRAHAVDAEPNDAHHVDDPAVTLCDAAPHVRLQAEQLARLLVDRLAEIDRREARLQVLAADLENEQRTARLLLVEREQDIERREAELAVAGLAVGAAGLGGGRIDARLDRFIRADTGRGNDRSDAPRTVRGSSHAAVAPDMDTVKSTRERALDEREARLDEIRQRLADEHRRLAESRQQLADWARRQRSEIERRAAELAAREATLDRRAAELERGQVERAASDEGVCRLRASVTRGAQRASLQSNSVNEK